MRPDEDRWHGSAEALARKIAATTDELMDLLGMADEILQHEAMPQPWDQWQRAVEACQDAWGEVASAGETRGNVDRVCRALRRCKIAAWPPETEGGE